MNILTRKLIAKDLYLHRWILVATAAAGIISLVLCTNTGMVFHVGSLIWISTFVSLGVVLALFGIATERKEGALRFVLSLPLSHRDYARIKVFALVLGYIGPWLVLSGGAVTLVLIAPHVPDGMVPFVMLMSGFMLANFTIVLCGALLTTSEGMTALLIIVTNVGVSLFMFVIGSLPGIQAYREGPVPVWNATFWSVLALEAAIAVIFCSIPCLIAARRRDFI